jgi:pectate lyase
MRPVGGAARAQGFPWRTYAERPAEWYRSDEGRQITANVLSNQSERGGWPKNVNTARKPYEGDRTRIVGTFDNGATFGELRYLARAFQATGEPRVRDAFLKGLDLTLAAQYPNGGFPQRYPPSPTGYDRHITFNDETMVNILQFLRDVSDSDEFAFVDSERRAAARKAFDRGIACILACQIRVNGKRTVWCAQHDEQTLMPQKARAYELPSLSGGESAAILLLLMSLEKPGPEVIRAIEAGAAWYEAAQLTGIRQEIQNGNKVIVRDPDPDAPPLWARFYEIETNRPFFCGRDGVKKYYIAEIESERRNGYAWYGTWGKAVAEHYSRWTGERNPSTTNP